MMKHFYYIIILLALNGATASAELEPTDHVGWYQDRQSVLQEVTSVAVLPVVFSVESDHEESAAQIIETRLESAIVEAGFNVIPASEFREFYHGMKVTMGGYYDPFTGDIDQEKFKSITELTYREFEREYDFDAYFRVSARPRPAYFSGNWARWDGTKAPVTGKTGFFAGTNSYGNIPALSLIGIMSTRDEENVLFLHASGVQLLSLIDGGFKRVPREEILSEADRIEEAMTLLTAPLITATLSEEAIERQKKEAKAEARRKRRERK